MYLTKINGVTYDQIPSTMWDISLRRFLALRKFDVREPLQLIYWALDKQATFSHEERTEQELANLLTLIDPVLSDVWEFMGSAEKKQVPEGMLVMDKFIKLKGGLLNELPYWAYVVSKSIYREGMTAAMANNEKYDPTDRYPEIIAHYLYSEVTGKPYLEKAAEEFAEVILDLPFPACIQLGNFFLSKLKSSSKSK